MKKLIISLAAILLLTLSISVASAGEREYGAGIRKPFFGAVVHAEVKEGYQIIHTIWPVEWDRGPSTDPVPDPEPFPGMVGTSSYDHIIVESVDKLLLTFEGIDTFTGTIGDSKPGTATFRVTGRTTRLAVGDEGAVEGHFELIPGSGTGGLKKLSSAHGVFQRQHDQPVGTYAIVYEFERERKGKREEGEGGQ
jgi:hypothetical protein